MSNFQLTVANQLSAAFSNMTSEIETLIDSKLKPQIKEIADLKESLRISDTAIIALSERVKHLEASN